ncbi:nucleotidyltransferase family protein [Tuberibacillus calidus]|mgnify:CR=1 FL=1|jgi:hypothetical protein|uniref:nucleotidyltransferase family protein n=1 Tax=Tuberibacillus calidus TaxID=340097 RepID=UPI00041B3773|nr:nucleotidyltransferase family protein [Tuberibacillus calidus]
MTIHSEKDIIRLIEADTWMMDILKAAKSLNLPDWWICAGFVRAKIWDTLHGFKQRTELSDIDVIYFDPEHPDEHQEKRYEEKLRSLLPHLPWSVKNEARMHAVNHIAPYTSSVDAISKFPETATALGVKLDVNDRVILTAPLGIQDVIQMEVKPSPQFIKDKSLASIYEQRLMKKNWKKTWPKIKVSHVSLT